MPGTRLAFQTAARAAAMTLIGDYAADAGLTGLQMYRARPVSIFPPCAFIESMAETMDDYTITTRQRRPSVLVRIVFGDFDSGTAVDQRDAFVDGFLDWVQDHGIHAAGGNTLIEGARVSDDPTWVPDWIERDNKQSHTYYTTLITLEGFTAT